MKKSISKFNQKEPIENEVAATEELDVQSGVIYVKCEVEPNEVEIVHSDNVSDTSETKELASLEPFIEYVQVDDYGQQQEEIESDIDIKPEMIYDETAEDNYVVDYTESKPDIISVVKSEGDILEIEPMEPFFLKSNPILKMEMIILQIKNQEGKDTLDPELIYEHQKYLCKSNSEALSSNYTCDICENSYGCLNCLKSHYETLHTNNVLMQYKCKNWSYVSKTNTCPVCELTFACRSQTFDHYITHAVICEICGSGFDRQLYLTDHYQIAHNKVNLDTTYECELCKRFYRCPMTLSNHYQNFHKMILCYVCKVRFCSVSELQEHEVIHQQKLNVLPFACSKCDKAFPKISDITVHIREDHKAETPEFKRVFIGAIDYQCVKEMPAKKKVKLKT